MSPSGAFQSKAPKSVAMLMKRQSNFLSKKDICTTKKIPGQGLLVDGLGKNPFCTEPRTVQHMYKPGELSNRYLLK